MLAYLRALLTGPLYGLLALLRSWIWILAVMAGFALLGELTGENWGDLIVAIFLLLLILVFQILLSYSIARESLVAIDAEWAIQREVSWGGAAWRFLGAALLSAVWLAFVIAVCYFVARFAGWLELPDDIRAEIAAWAQAKAANPGAPVPGYEHVERVFLLLSFTLTAVISVFTTTFVAAAAGNGLLSRNGWVIGHATLRMTLAALIYGWFSWLLLALVTRAVIAWEWNVGIALATVQIASWAVQWAMLMGCAAQVYVQRLNRDIAAAETETAQVFSDEARENTARAIRAAWMEDDRR